MQLCSINVENFDKLLKKDEDLYIFPQGKKGTINDRYKQAFYYIFICKVFLSNYFPIVKEIIYLLICTELL